MTIKRKEKSVPLKDDCVGAQRSGTLPQKTMVIVHDYWLDGKTTKGIFYVRSREIVTIHSHSKAMVGEEWIFQPHKMDFFCRSQK